MTDSIVSMKYEGIFNNHFIRYTLKEYSQSKHVRLSVHSDGQVIISAPKGMHKGFIESFIHQKADWLAKKIQEFARLTPLLPPKVAQAQYQRYRKQARSLAWERIGAMEHIYGVQVNRVIIRNQKTRWGSCSKKGNLNFNYHIIFLSSEQLDYVIAHELAHLREFNHSRHFWTLVAQVSPEYRKVKKELRQYLLS